jgi:hypothetical protein
VSAEEARRWRRGELTTRDAPPVLPGVVVSEGQTAYGAGADSGLPRRTRQTGSQGD